jgi:hypothetical protein
MQIALAEILLNGNLQHSTVRVVSAPEVAILREIHGNDAIINLSEVNSVRRSPAEELDRLKLYYGPDVVSKVFPGSMPKLPTSLEDVGIQVPKTKAVQAEASN